MTTHIITSIYETEVITIKERNLVVDYLLLYWRLTRLPRFIYVLYPNTIISCSHNDYQYMLNL